MARMDFNRDRSRLNNDNKGATSDRFFSPLPDKAGQKHNNPVLIPQFYPAHWRLFNPTPEMCEKYGMLTGSLPMDLESFYMTIPVHAVSNFQREDGSTCFSYTICPKCLNQWLVKTMDFKPLFSHPRCAYCEESSEQWERFNARWEELGYDEARRKGLSKEEYKLVSDRDGVLKTSRELAKKFSATERYALLIWDYAQMIGERPFRENQTQVECQVYLAPKRIFTGLAQILDIQGDDAFYEMRDPSNIQTVMIAKDTTRCSDKNFLQTEYSVLQGKRVTLDSAWFNYVTNPESLVDLTSMVPLLTYDEQRYYLGLNDKTHAAQEDQAAVNNVVKSAPQAPPSPPMAPQAPPMPPAPPSVPQAPATPQAPPMPPAPPSVPQVPAVPQAPPVPEGLFSADDPEYDGAPIPPPAQRGPAPMPPVPTIPGVDRTAAGGKKRNW